MSRRRFYTPQTTYSSFIHSIEEYKHSREPSLTTPSSAASQSLSIPIGPDSEDAAYVPSPRPTSPLIPASSASPTRPLSSVPLSFHLPPAADAAAASSSSSSHHLHGEHLDLWLSRRNLDAVIKRKSLLIFLNALFGIVLAILLLELGWDGHVYHDDDPPGALPVLMALKVALFASSCVLVYQLLERKQTQISIKYREKRRKTRQIVKPPLSTVSLLSLLSVRPSAFRWKLWLQCLVCFFHPFPFFSCCLLPGHFPNKLALLMALRLHLIFRVIRDHSEIWLNRRSIKRLTAFSSRTPNFDWWLSMKTLVYRSPVAFASSFYLLCVLIFGYAIYILEREAQPQLFTAPIGWYLAFQCITIDWASDVYDVYDPVTWLGKLTCLTAAMMGLLLTSFIIGIVSQSILPSRFEEMALNCLAEGTLVALAEGRSVPIEQVQEGDAVLSYQAALAAGEEEGLAVRQVSAVLDRGRRECVELVFSDGRSLVCTPDHRIRTYDGRWVEAGQLVIGVDEVAVGVDYPESTGVGVGVAGAAGAWRLATRTTLGYDLNMAERATHSLAFARLLGYVLTDGCVTDETSRLYLGHQLDVEAALRDVYLLMGTRPAVSRGRRTLDFAVPRPLYRAFLTVVEVLGKRTAQISRFPAFLMDPDCPLPIVREFLGALFGGDGHTQRLSHKRGPFASMGGLGFGTTRLAAQAAEQQQVLERELFALLQRVGIDTSAITSNFNTVAPNTLTKKGRKKFKEMQSQGLTVAPRRTADTLDASRSYVLMFEFSSYLVVAFARCVGFRYCCHKQQRLVAAAAYYRGDAFLARQKEAVSARARELRSGISVPVTVKLHGGRVSVVTAIRQAKPEVAEREELLPSVVAWLPRSPADLQPRKRGKGGGATLLEQLTAMDSRRFFSQRRSKRRYSAAARRAVLSSQSAAPAAAPAAADVIDLITSDDDDVKVDEAGVVIPPPSAASPLRGSGAQPDWPRRSSISQPTSSAVYSTATTALATPSPRSSRRSSPDSSQRGRSYSAVSTDAEGAAMEVDEDDELDSVERRRRAAPKRRKLSYSAAESGDTAAEAAERPASATGRPRRATRREVNYNEEQPLGELADEAASEVSEADSEEHGRDDAEDAQDDADADEDEDEDEEEEEAEGSRRRSGSGGDSDSEGDAGVYESKDKVPYGVHRDARVLPLFRVRLVGRRAVGQRRVWDLSVPSPQGELSRSFVANGVVVHNCISVERARQLERENAARLIQYVWRNYRHEKELAEKLHAKNPRLYEEISALEEKEFMEEFLARSKMLRNVRRERVELEEQLMGRAAHRGGDGLSKEGVGGGRYEDGLVVSGDGEWRGRDGDGVTGQLRRLAEQNEEIKRWLLLLLEEKAKVKRKGRRDRERRKRKKEEEERRAREATGTADQQQQQQQLAGPSPQPLNTEDSGRHKLSKQNRKAQRKGRGERGEDVSDVVGEVDESGVVRPADRRRSISYGELRELERWGEAGEAKGDEDAVVPGAVEERKEEEEQEDEEHRERADVVASLPSPPSAPSALAPSAPTPALTSYRPPSFPTLPSVPVPPRSLSLPLSAYALSMPFGPKPQATFPSLPLSAFSLGLQAPQAAASTTTPVASLSLTPQSLPSSSASSASSSAVSSPSPLRAPVPHPLSPVPDAGRREGDEEEEEEDEQLDTSLSDVTDGDDQDAVRGRARWREDERERERRRRVRSLSPHSVALAQTVISAMIGGGSRRRSERKEERRRGEGEDDGDEDAGREAQRRESRARDLPRDRPASSFLSPPHAAGGAVPRRASISGPLMSTTSPQLRGVSGGGRPSTSGAPTERLGGQRESALTSASFSVRHHPQTPNPYTRQV